MKKIIFLDIDGVLATPSCIKDGMWALCNEKQELLGNIISDTGSKIVLSSSWRCDTLDNTKQSLIKKGFLFNDYLIGITIRAYQFLEKGTNIHLSIPRGVEIKQWIDTHIHSEYGKNYKRKILGKDYQYVILDDDSDMLLEHKDNFIRTEGEIGLTSDNVRLSINILNKNY